MEYNEEQISYMRRALELAEKARGFTEPNPLVGAVIVKDGEIVGEGYHKKAGTPHAEINALSMALDKAMGATMYVTLEPCSHYGKTPPCANALIRAGINEVFVAMEDPNPLVNGKGINLLRAAGIQVHTGLLRDEATEQNRVFLTNQQKNRPYIALKSAQSIDGKIGPEGGETLTITGLESRKLGHQLRQNYGAVLVGIETVIKDNPHLNIRNDIPHPEGRPTKVILDPHMRLPLNCDLLVRSDEPVLIYTTTEVSTAIKNRIEHTGGYIITMKDTYGKLNLENVMSDLYRRGICGVLVEGGGKTLTGFFKNDLWDEYHCFIAPKFLGKNGVDLFADDSVLFPDVESKTELCGEDVHITYKNKNGVKLCSQELSKKPEPSERSEIIHLVRR